MSARVVGLDLSITATGIAWCDGTTYTVTHKAKGDARLVAIESEASRAVEGRSIDLVVIEDLPTHAHSAGITGMVHGVVRAWLIKQHVPYALITPATLKKYATGKGNADKTAMALAAYKRAGLEVADDNQVDAWWLRAAGLDHLGEPVAVLPAPQRAALDKVAWPSPATVAPQRLCHLAGKNHLCNPKCANEPPLDPDKAARYATPFAATGTHCGAVTVPLLAGEVA